jgi:hypothetical protein
LRLEFLLEELGRALFAGLFAGLFGSWSSDWSDEFVDAPRGSGGWGEGDELLAEVQVLVGGRNALLQGRLELVVAWIKDKLGGEASRSGLRLRNLDQIELGSWLLSLRLGLGSRLGTTFNKDLFVVVEDGSFDGRARSRSREWWSLERLDFRTGVAGESGDFLF